MPVAELGAQPIEGIAEGLLMLPGTLLAIGEEARRRDGVRRTPSLCVGDALDQGSTLGAPFFRAFRPDRVSREVSLLGLSSRRRRTVISLKARWRPAATVRSMPNGFSPWKEAFRDHPGLRRPAARSARQGADMSMTIDVSCRRPATSSNGSACSSCWPVP